MFSYRITKYNPKYRNSLGAYLKDDWISFYDIGNIFDGEVLTYNEYIKIENAYIQAIVFFMDFLNINSLCLFNMHKFSISPSEFSSESLSVTYNTVSEGQCFDKEKIVDIVRLRLRENILGKLENKKMFVHFGYDYYMFIGSIKEASPELKEKIEKLGLFVEDFRSPYLPDIDEENVN